MENENETVAMVLLDFEYLIALGNIGPKVATDIKRRIQSANQREVGELCGDRNGILNSNASLAADNDRLRREVAELKKKCEEYERQPELMAETANAALKLLKSQDAKIAELRECLEQAYGDKTGTYTMKGNEVEWWRKALRERRGRRRGGEEMSESKLKPCPFCEGKCSAETVKTEDLETGEVCSEISILCYGKDGVGCGYQSKFFTEEAEAIAAHNRVACAVEAMKKGDMK